MLRRKATFALASFAVEQNKTKLMTSKIVTSYYRFEMLKFSDSETATIAQKEFETTTRTSSRVA